MCDIATARTACYAGFMKPEPQRVILYGNSLILAGMQASLGSSSFLECIALDRSPEDTAETVQALHPAAVIFDLGEGQPEFHLSLLQQPNLLLIGIDPETDRMLVWSGQTETVAAATGLLKFIQQRSKA